MIEIDVVSLFVGYGAGSLVMGIFTCLLICKIYETGPFKPKKERK